MTERMTNGQIWKEKNKTESVTHLAKQVLTNTSVAFGARCTMHP